MQQYTVVNIAITNRHGNTIKHDDRSDELLDTKTCPLCSLRGEARIVIDP